MSRIVLILRRLVISFLLAPLIFSGVASAQTLGETFQKDYKLTDLGRVRGLPTRQGGLVLKSDDANVLLIGGNANRATGKLFAVKVRRSDDDSIESLGNAAFFADAPYNDGGLCYAPNGVLLCAQWPVNNLGQLAIGARTPGRVLNLGGESQKHSLASLNFFAPTGHLKMLTWSSGGWYDAQLRPAGDGSYDVVRRTHVTNLQGGPEGFVYVPKGSPQFPKPSLLVAEWSAGNVVAYEITETGDPVPETRRVFVGDLHGAEGGMIDPLTGDFLFTTFGGGDRVIRVDGLKKPDSSDPYYPPRRVLRIPGAEPTGPESASMENQDLQGVQESSESDSPNTSSLPTETTNRTRWRLKNGTIVLGLVERVSKQHAILKLRTGRTVRIRLDRFEDQDRELINQIAREASGE